MSWAGGVATLLRHDHCCHKGQRSPSHFSMCAGVVCQRRPGLLRLLAAEPEGVVQTGAARGRGGGGLHPGEWKCVCRLCASISLASKFRKAFGNGYFVRLHC